MVVAGIDEVGRGSWAGPIVAAVVVLDPNRPIAGLKDSKLLNKNQRAELASEIQREALGTGIGWAPTMAIDSGGITSAVKSAMEQAVRQLVCEYDHIIIDGKYNFLPGYSGVTTMVAADKSVPAVSAASIVAKVARDRYMADYAAKAYPQYGFENHVGYGTRQHISALLDYGVTDLHRKSFKPIRQLLLQSKP